MTLGCAACHKEWNAICRLLYRLLDWNPVALTAGCARHDAACESEVIPYRLMCIQLYDSVPFATQRTCYVHMRAGHARPLLGRRSCPSSQRQPCCGGACRQCCDECSMAWLRLPRLVLESRLATVQHAVRGVAILQGNMLLATGCTSQSMPACLQLRCRLHILVNQAPLLAKPMSLQAQVDGPVDRVRPGCHHWLQHHKFRPAVPVLASGSAGHCT